MIGRLCEMLQLSQNMLLGTSSFCRAGSAFRGGIGRSGRRGAARIWVRIRGSLAYTVDIKGECSKCWDDFSISARLGAPSLNQLILLLAVAVFGDRTASRLQLAFDVVGLEFQGLDSNI